MKASVAADRVPWAFFRASATRLLYLSSFRLRSESRSVNAMGVSSRKAIKATMAAGCVA